MCGVVSVLAAALVLAACSSSGNGEAAPAGGGGGSSKAATGTPYHVGAVVSETGGTAATYGYTGGELQAWASWTNAHGGVNGHPVELTVLDDQSSIALGLQDAQKLISQHVIAIFGGATNALFNFYPAVAKAGIPVIGNAEAGAGGVSTLGPMFYAAGGSGTQAPVPTAEYWLVDLAKAQGVTTIAGAYCLEIAACNQVVPLLGQAAQMVGGVTVKDSQGVLSNAPNYISQCLSWKNAGVTGVVLNLTSTTEQELAASCAQENYHPVWLGYNDSVFTYWGTDPNFNHFIGAVTSFLPVGDSPLVQTFNAAMKQYYPKAADDFVDASNAWATGEIFKEAAKLANLGDNPTPAQVIAGLNMFENNTVGGVGPSMTYTNGNRLNPCAFSVTQIDGKLAPISGHEMICAPKTKGGSS